MPSNKRPRKSPPECKPAISVKPKLECKMPPEMGFDGAHSFFSLKSTATTPDQEEVDISSEDEFRTLEKRMLLQWSTVPSKKEEEDEDIEIVKCSKRQRVYDTTEGDEGDDEGDEQEPQSSEDELTTTMDASVRTIKNQFRERYKFDLKRCIAENYCCAVTQVQSRETERSKMFQHVPFKKFGTSKKREGINDRENPTTKIHLVHIGKTEALPVSISYATVRKSVMQEDDKSLRFLPYFGENDNIKLDFNAYSSDEEESDVEDVADDDAILAATEHYGTSPRALESLSEVLKFSLDIIKKRTNELTFFFERRTLEQRQMLHYYNFDLENTDMMTDSYQKLFCRRCSIFDCRYHGLFQPRPCSGKTDRRFFVDSSFQQSLKIFQEDASIVSPALPLVIANKKRKKEGRTVEYCNGVWSPQSEQHALNYVCTCSSSPPRFEKHETWTVPESAIFRKLFFVFGAQFCAIAQVLGSKTCTQVREYACDSPFLLVHRALMHVGGAEEEKRKKGVRAALKVPQGCPPQHSACDHLGPCDADCSCVSSGMLCEAYCPCDSACRNRFLGCVCKTFCRTRACPCFAASRECTPGLCEGCAASSTKPMLETAEPEVCCNVSIQTRNFKQLLLAKSTIHGWGAFSADDAVKNELITEYVGEVITQEEADRRGKIYDKLNRSYLFNLNEQYVIDAARKGNKIKFANHSQNPNCFSKVMLVNGDHRIGIYAKKKIRKGDELFFDYQHEYLGQAPEWFEKNERKEHSLQSSASRKS